MPRRSLCLLPFLFLAACQGPPAARANEPDVLPKGTKVDAILMHTLESGVSQEGQPVSFAVAEDVKGKGGQLVLRRGTPIRGEVAWSRRENTLSALVNEPARLTVRVTGTESADGKPVVLAVEESLDIEKPFEFNRGNTGRPDPSPEVEKLLADAANEDAVKALGQLLEGEKPGLLESAEGKAKVQELAKQLGLGQTARLVETGEVGKAHDLIRQIRQGSTVSALATGGAPLALDAVFELASFAGTVGNRVSRMLRGRNIKAYPGTRITLYVAKDIAVGG